MASLAPKATSPLAKVAVGVLLCVLLLAGYWFIFHSDLEARIVQQNARTSQLNNELAEQRRAEVSYFADRDELAMREQKQREYNRILPTDTEPAAFLSAIQAVANLSGVNLKGWQPQEEVKEQFFAKVPMKLELEGKFHQVARFAHEIGRTDRIINIEDLEISDARTEADEVVVKVRCLATTFHLITAQVANPAPGTPGAPGGAGQ